MLKNKKKQVIWRKYWKYCKSDSALIKISIVLKNVLVDIAMDRSVSKGSRWVGIRIDWNDLNQNVPKWNWIWFCKRNEQWKNENGLKLIQIENVEGNWPAGLISTIGVCCVQNEK